MNRLGVAPWWAGERFDRQLVRLREAHAGAITEGLAGRGRLEPRPDNGAGAGDRFFLGPAT